ncbi:serine hydrolase domain-containing protein [Dethiobacter alkaliphilus]|uniref:Beta-lactamase n=1 Tax=Dethiobacter alkaliphilus AHT 1 TaxID=555088 RepID=C0GFD9_DETAL|nr:serine hydrolase domain-containing protein [Dethiobacter alkaliphilus]EEG77899.1 beta-lactamase [Dethiobacter alkaliphilus AHT 1]
MKNEKAKKIESLFRKQVQKDKKVNNAYLLVHSEKEGIDLNIAEGRTGDTPANPRQPIYMASVGKLFTATIVGILFEEGKIDFDDSITKYLDKELSHNLHVYKGTDYTKEIKVRHLLNQTSGLADYFWALLEKVLEDPNFTISPREAVIWGKNNLKPHFPPGKGYKYTDTNYHLLGLIVENITGEPFHAALSKYIFKPLGMKHSYMLHYSEPMEKSPYPIADFTFNGIRMNDHIGYAGLDYAGGGVVAPTEDLLKFMKALTSYQVVLKDTLEIMKNDSAKFQMGIEYGYGIWQITTVPLMMPKKLNSWGVYGVTGAFMFYHPEKDAYLIGCFNDVSYQSKGLRYMMFNVINKLF